jgi:protein SCO1/2
MVSRRQLLLGANSAAPQRAAATPAPAKQKRFDARYFGNLIVVTHEGERVDFYRDLLHNKVVAINMMYATCEGTCPLTTANLVRVQERLGDKVGRDIHFYSITLRAQEDTPQVLKEYAEMHEVGPGWKFLTGAPSDIETLRLKLGFYDLDPKVDQDKEKHTGMMRIFNDKFDRWAMAPTTADPEQIIRTIRFIARRG